MFNSFALLNELNLNNFNTNKVTNIYRMFFGCLSLKKINLNSFNIKKVTNMGYMFCGCSLLKELILSNFNFNNDTNMSFLFSGCSKKFITKIKNRYKSIKDEAFLIAEILIN